MGNTESQQQVYQRKPNNHHDNRHNNHQRHHNRPKPIPNRLRQQPMQKQMQQSRSQQPMQKQIQQPYVKPKPILNYAQQQEQYLQQQLSQNNFSTGNNNNLQNQLEAMQQQMDSLKQQINSNPTNQYNGSYNPDFERPQQNYGNNYGNENYGYNILTKQYDFKNVNLMNVNDKIKEFESEEERKDRLFREEQEKRLQQFNEQKRRNREYFDREIQLFEQSRDDPYKILGLDRKNTNLSQIKKAYRFKANKYHPDRGGDPEMFKKITQSYCYLVNKYNDEEELYYKTQQEVRKKEYNPDMEINKGYKNIHLNKDDFNINKFNEIFNEYRMNNPYDDGYGDIMTNDKRTDEKIDVKSMFDNQKFNKDIFNKTFENDKNDNGEMIVYEEPQALLSSGGAYQELGQTRISDFTTNNATDYKKAYSKENKFINPDKVKYKKYKNINELKADRANVSHHMSSEDKRKYEQRQLREQEREKKRRQKVKEDDEAYLKQFEKLNQLFLKD